MPDLGIKYTVIVYLDGDVAKEISISLDQRNFSVLYDAFVGKYGPPTSMKDSVDRSNLGAVFSSKHIFWIGRNISISMYERLDRVDKSWVTISNNFLGQMESETKRKKFIDEYNKF